MIAPDMATMLSFVFTDAPIAAPVLQAMLSKRAETSLQLRSPSTATPRPPTRCCCSPPARPASAARRDRATPAIRGSPASGARSTGCCSISPIRWCATARARASSSRSMSTGAATPRSAKRIALVDRQLAAGQDRHRRRGRQLGPRRHGGRQGRRAGRPRPPVDLRSATSGSRHKGARDPAYDEAEVSAYMKARGHRHRRRSRPRQGAGHGVDLRPHEGLCRDQRRLSELRRYRAPRSVIARSGATKQPRGLALGRGFGVPGLLRYVRNDDRRTARLTVIP